MLNQTERAKLISEILKAFESNKNLPLDEYTKRWNKAMEVLDKYLGKNESQ